jgi:peptide chain release factor 2
MSEENFWQDKINSKNIIKEKKLFEELTNNFKESIQKLNDLSDLNDLAEEENDENTKDEIIENIKDLRQLVKKN